jgi:hypothetical protein
MGWVRRWVRVHHAQCFLFSLFFSFLIFLFFGSVIAVCMQYVCSMCVVCTQYVRRRSMSVVCCLPIACLYLSILLSLAGSLVRCKLHFCV